MNNKLYNMLMSIFVTICGIVVCIMFYLYNFNELHSNTAKIIVIIALCIINIVTAVISTITILTYLEEINNG